MALTRWREEPDLAGLREPAALNELPDDERKECRALWAAVASVREIVSDVTASELTP
jgi:eukaryotic-like serine/threonine-protein kinase